MNQLEKLRTSLTNLTHEQLIEKVREIRADRRINKSGIPKSVEKKSKRKSSIISLLDALSPEEREALIAQLEGDENNG